MAVRTAVVTNARLDSGVLESLRDGALIVAQASLAHHERRRPELARQVLGVAPFDQ
jgi:hypothetical protein